MAENFILQVAGDIDGPIGDHETVRFVVDDETNEFDISLERADEFRRLLESFIDIARPAEVAPAPTERPSVEHGHTATRNWAIRTWAWEHGYRVADRGPIPGEIVALYDAAQV
ncbi:Lsr2 family protein [Gordonia sp. CPCC 206044]|uniref:histone-like nucleoid-structuring protein Lsr2 n=1 Tax=Gordonia sp. CPCC 206044 TaxID=3140793 RepID=UPI003AF3DF98